MNYHELEKLPAHAYLNPENFITEYDHVHIDNGYNQDQYNHGLEIGTEYDVVKLNYRGVWSAERAGSLVTSYEGIGYHAGTAFLLMGFLDSGCRIEVYREGWQAIVP